MKLSDLTSPRGANRKPKRRGRGSGSGHGKTSCRGHKGQKARAGGRSRPGFEGGQMPLARRIPKRGFTARAKKRFQLINVQALNLFDEGSVVAVQNLLESGLITKHKPVKILGDGKLTRSLTVKADRFTKAAIRKIEEAGGRAECLRP